jgi:type I restriction enzyme S subunit
MKQGWEIKRLDDACKVEYGTRVVQKKDGGTVYPVYGGGGATFFMDTFNREDCLVVARFAMSAQCTRFVEGKFFLNDSGLTVRPKNDKELLPDFLNLQMFFLNDHIYSLARGTAQRNLDVPAFRNIQIAYPKSIQEQQRIVSILDEAFAAIEKAKVNAEHNLKNAKELFESYLQGVFENGNWEKKKWGELCDFVRGPFGGSLKKNVFKESGYVVYEQKHAIHDHFNQLRYFIDEQKFNEMKRFEVFPGDIIMSCSGVTLGRVAVVPEGIPKGIINQALLKLTPKKNVSVHFIKHWLRSSIFQKIIFDYSGGAAIPNVPSAKILKDIKIPYPSLKEQERIVCEIETVLNETKRLEEIYQNKIDDLDELKKSILQKAFAGELKTEKAVAV